MFCLFYQLQNNFKFYPEIIILSMNYGISSWKIILESYKEGFKLTLDDFDYHTVKRGYNKL